MRDLDALWIACAASLDLPVARGGDAFVHFDGRTLWIARDEDLDEDDSLAQLVLHEICHMAVQGPALRHVADWGLDSTSDRHETNERGAVRLQVHLTAAFGLRGALYPTSEVRAFFESLPSDALGDPRSGDASVAMARAGAERMARGPFAPAVKEALQKTARHVKLPRHGSGWPLVGEGDPRTCASCAWRTRGGCCRQAARAIRVPGTARACARHEARPDCAACGACCRSAFDLIPVGRRSPALRHRGLVVKDGVGWRMARRESRCAALEGSPAGPYTCGIYADRPTACRDLEVAGRHCLSARRRVGLTL